MKIKNTLIMLVITALSYNTYAEVDMTTLVEIKVTQEERSDSSVHNFPIISQIDGNRLEKLSACLMSYSSC